jgi:hypothetical protein
MYKLQVRASARTSELKLRPTWSLRDIELVLNSQPAKSNLMNSIGDEETIAGRLYRDLHGLACKVGK